VKLPVVVPDVAVRVTCAMPAIEPTTKKTNSTALDKKCVLCIFFEMYVSHDYLIPDHALPPESRIGVRPEPAIFRCPSRITTEFAVQD
jgi:hypothetical protein